ncbi:hypothetical protein ACFW2Y_19045 [Streptomyces sp. NPDC058877]|uniref:hypothetical protein n=1 Tax=unclassified Streptomyces TaxID=2593676 RepID=UPI003675CFF2
MTGSTTSEWWEALPEGLREQVDGHVLQDSRFRATRIVWEACRSRGLRLHDAELVVHDRYLVHGDRIARTPLSPLDLASLSARASGCPGRVVAIEAVWDGDTVHDWFVLLLAVSAEPAGDHHLATVHRETAVRYWGDARRSGSRRPEAAAADAAGRALAEHLDVPFHFASPDTPDDEAPRWQP